MSSSVHPFEPLYPTEISHAVDIVRPVFSECDLNFRFITLREPRKSEMTRFLDQKGPSPARTARIQVVTREKSGPGQLIELVVDLDHSSVISRQDLKGKHPYIDTEYMKEVEKATMGDDRVKQEIKSLNLPEGAFVVAEPWAYATDGMNDMSQRVSMVYFYLRILDHTDANHYAYPLDVCAEVSEQLKVTKVYRLPSTADGQIHNDAHPFDERRVQAILDSEYCPSLRSPDSYRKTTKPLQVTQPEGPSFQVQGKYLTWEKWSFYVGFNYREGLTLHDIRYDGRSMFYRLSLAEMFVPYGDPRTPYPRKAAFDIGSDGAGINANNLRLGCDCLGVIKYFDGWHNTSSGEPMKLPNVVCCHEQDDGVLWKHTNFRTGNPVVTRSRILVLQTIITVTNYEYIFAFHFGQDASIHYEVRATGILSTCPIDIGEKVPYGTVVAPGVLAPYHQHLFSLRIDPAIDGHSNSLQVEESVPMPIDDAKIHNPLGVGYITKSIVIENEQGLDLDISKNRVFKIINEGKLNPVNGHPVGFKLFPHPSQMLLAHPSSFHAKRSEFASHAVWVTRYDDEEMFPAGRHTMQSPGGDGIASAIERRRNEPDASSSVRDDDIVIWHTFGSTHNPRIEDWPVMPCEKMTVGLKPVNFFTGNPGMDVAVSSQESNHSRQVDGAVNGNANGCH